MLDALLEWDTWLFGLVNGQWRAEWLDILLPIVRNKLTWIPLYVLITAILFWKYNWQQALGMLLLTALAILLADQLSSELIKKSVMRIRPCNDPDLQEQLQLLVHCGSGYSFTSSHATNHFALATLFIQFLAPLVKHKGYKKLLIAGLLLWATSVAYAQVYVGVHYPLDVLAGALSGSLLGLVLCWLYKKIISEILTQMTTP